ncbi:MAG: hypothetical protein IT214_07465 [Chitinophagaceae bacterium]|jgi:hypothetical protein|nr:hypothetical protein [Chitinophagaceae bacterium]OQY96332.1 MAG: hypothetical protein B6D37_02240 [Sphingobacteriales bacterium UTBCD1]
MFDDILNEVKQALGNHPEVASLSPDQQEALHNAIANHINNTVQNQPAAVSSGGGLLSSLENALTSNSPVTGAVEGGIVSSLASKFGLSPAFTGAIAGALPGLIQKFKQKV